ncbi:hypothetical protein ACKKBG_A16705 [Auxenochlorella protothecoides x Auxenochlorella symbiontica]
MASGDILVAYRKLYRKAGEEIESFRKHEAQLTSLLRTISNVVLRLPALERPENLGDLGTTPGVCKRLVVAQTLALQQLLLRAQVALGLARQSAAGLGRLAQEGVRLVQQNRALTAGARARPAGPIPSVDQCIAGLQDIAHTHNRQGALLAALVDEAHAGTEADEWPHILAASTASLCIDRRRVGDLLYVMEQTEEKRRL